MEKEKKKNKSLVRKGLKISAWVLGVLILLFFILVLFLRSAWGQDVVVQRAVKYVSKKTHSKVEIEKLFVTFDGNIVLKGLYVEDPKGDTLIYSKSLTADIPLMPIIRGNGIGVDYLKWEGLKARVIRKDSIEGYNFQYLIDAFVSDDASKEEVAIEDSDSSPMKIVIGDVEFSDFDIIFNDAVLGIDSDVKLGNLGIHMKKTDLENMDFRASKITLANTFVNLKQTPVPSEPEEDEESVLPFLQLDELSLKNIFVNYEAVGEMTADVELNELLLELKKADLANNTFEIGTFSLKNTIANLNMVAKENVVTEAAEDVQDEVEEQMQDFEWPDFVVSIAKIDLIDNQIGYFVGDNQVKKGLFNPNAIALEDLNLKIKDVYLKDKTAGLQLDELTFEEGSGLNMKEFTTSLAATDEFLELNDLKLHLNDNKLKGKAKVEYTELAQLIDNPENSKIALQIPSFQVDAKEAFRFQPELRNNEYLVALSQKRLTGNLDVSGYLSSMDIPTMNLRWGGDTKISVRGHIDNATDMDHLRFNIPSFSAETKRGDLLRFVSEEELGVSLPEDVLLQGSAKGNLEDVIAQADLTTTQGIVTVEGEFKNGQEIAFDADLKIQEYKLNELLNNDQIGSLSLNVKTSGSGNNINELNAVLDANISSLELGGYAIKDWAINSEIIDGKGDLVTGYKDQNIDLDLTANIVLDSIAPQASAYLNLKGVNLKGLGLMDRDIRAGLKLDVDFDGDKDGFDIISTIGDGVVIYEDNTYMIGDVLATAHVRSDTTSIWLDNKILQLSVESNSDPGTFGKALQQHISSYFSKQEVERDSMHRPVKLKAIGRVAQAPVLNRVFLMNVRELDTINFGAYFDEESRRLLAKVIAPHIDYDGNTLDGLVFNMDTDRQEFNFDLGFENIKAGPLDIPKTTIKGNQVSDALNLVFTSEHDDAILSNIKAQIAGTAEELRFRVLPEDLILDRNAWTIPADNEMVIMKDKVTIHNFRFSRGDEMFRLTDSLPKISKEHVAVEFENFKLSEILNYLNPDEELAKGVLNGSFALTDPFTDKGIAANLRIDNLEVMDVDMGKMTLQAETKNIDRYDFRMALKEGNIDLDLKGDYTVGPEVGKPNIDLRINEVKMKALEGLSMGEITNADGALSGRFRVGGTTSDLKYNGNLDFKNATLTIAQFNASFSMLYESLKIDNEGISMNEFTILDENKNELVFSGKIGTESFSNPTFDLRIDAEDFQVLNADEDDNDFLYGEVSFDAHGTLKGDLNVPKLDMEIHIDDNTDVTYILPSSTVAIEDRDGVVVFVNREDPDSVLTRTEEQTATVTGFDVNVYLKIGEKARAGVIIDEQTGDNFEIYGEGDFNFTMNPNGRMTLTGLYEIGGGHYEMNLYSLVNRRFELVKGSKVSWAGDPFDAKLDVRAVYKLETSASALMAPISSGADPASKGKYRQVLPFEVYLNVDGVLEQPEVSFNLDMPEDEQGAIGGQVYGRIQQVNQQEGELNRQIFSLLVLNRFYPEPGSDGSGGGFAAIARDNLNDAISDQLNAFSDKLLGNTGFELDFGLDTYTDYQGDSPEQRTQLDIAAQKKLFDDRLIVRVGSEVNLEGSNPNNEPTPIIGNVSMEYLLTENGRYRIKGFRKNSYENVIDGQTIVSGLALIFTQEFNKFKELGEAILKGETKEEKAARKEAKARLKEREEKEKEKQRLLEEKERERKRVSRQKRRERTNTRSRRGRGQ